MNTGTNPKLSDPKKITTATAHDDSARLDVFVRQNVTVLIYPMGADLGKHGFGKEKAVYLYEMLTSEGLRDKFLEQIVARQTKPENVRISNEMFELTYRFADLGMVYASAERVQFDLYD